MYYATCPASVGLIAAAGVGGWQGSGLNTANWTGFTPGKHHGHGQLALPGLAAVLLVLTRLPKIKKAHPLYFTLGSACVGIAFGYLGWI